MRANIRFVLFLTLGLAIACSNEDSDKADNEGKDTAVDTNAGTESEGAETETESETEGDSETIEEQDSAEETDTGSQAPAEFPLEVGDMVPDFSLPAHDGSTFTLSDYAGQIVLIGAHPFAGTTVCTQQTKDLEANYDKFQSLNTVPFALGTDGTAKQATWADQMGLENVKILSDAAPKGEVSKMFGIFDNMTKAAKRAVLIIDQEGKLHFKQTYNTMICPKLDPIFEELENLQ